MDNDVLNEDNFSSDYDELLEFILTSDKVCHIA